MSYVRGRRAEHYAISKLRQLGADMVIRSSRSMGAADLVAVFFPRREVWFLQVKSEKRELDLKKLEREYPELWELRGLFTVKSGFFLKRKGKWKAILD